MSLIAVGVACGGPAASPDAGGHGVDATTTPAPASIGAHALAYHRLGGDVSPLSTPAMTTRESGSTMLVSVGRGQIGAFSLPTDSKGNTPYAQLGSTHPYTQWPSSGTALYAFAPAAGGSGHVVQAETPAADEITLAAVEIVGRGVIQDVQWREALAGSPLTTASVTTTGPATLVAFWWGDADTAGDKTATPNNGFVVIDSILLAGALVQCAVAAKEVAAAGSYDVTWTATPLQGAQLWLVAVQ